mmetsp:Transcript_3563/g.10231  ORF Transcript_3563/g.10231 Transcript_3563/m.10231 type:complete len:222 (+) Transcript_3563:667-1332(+)
MAGWHLYCRRRKWMRCPSACSLTKSGRTSPWRLPAAGEATTGGSWQGSPAAMRNQQLEVMIGRSDSGSTIWLDSSRMSTSKRRPSITGREAEQQVTPTTLAVLRRACRALAPPCKRSSSISPLMRAASLPVAVASICLSSASVSFPHSPSEECMEYLSRDLSDIRLRDPTRMMSVKPVATSPDSILSTATLVWAATSICRGGPFCFAPGSGLHTPPHKSSG